jgi:uncharacterized lipoprotein NlpE involved in copper resistance
MKKTIISILLIASLVLSGCITIQQPDGTTETRVDIDTTIALTQLALTSAEQALALWLQYQATMGTLDAEQVAREAEARQAKIDILRGTLSDLMAIKAAQNATISVTPTK